jgi:hypothetical protein
LNFHLKRIIFGLLAGLILSLTGCQGATKKDEARPPPLTPQEHLNRLYEVGEGFMGQILPARNRSDFLREHREVSSHLTKVENDLYRRRISLNNEEQIILRNSRDTLANVGQKLQSRRIKKGTAKEIFKQLEKVHASFGLFYRRYNTSPYQGFLTRPEGVTPPKEY